MRIKKFIRPILLSLMVLGVIPTIAFLFNQRWFMYVFTPLLVILVWVLEISRFETPLDIKAREEAISMLGRKKRDENAILGSRGIPKNEDIIDVPEPARIEPVYEVTKAKEIVKEPVVPSPIQQPVAEDPFIAKMRKYKNDLNNISINSKEVEKEKQDLIDEYNEQMNIINLKLKGLLGSEKEIKEKMMELM